MAYMTIQVQCIEPSNLGRQVMCVDYQNSNTIDTFQFTTNYHDKPRKGNERWRQKSRTQQKKTSAQKDSESRFSGNKYAFKSFISDSLGARRKRIKRWIHTNTYQNGGDSTIITLCVKSKFEASHLVDNVLIIKKRILHRYEKNGNFNKIGHNACYYVT